jgi:hypothetical protein
VINIYSNSPFSKLLQEIGPLSAAIIILVVFGRAAKNKIIFAGHKKATKNKFIFSGHGWVTKNNG